MSKLLITNVEIVTDGPNYEKKFIGIENNKIAYIGTEKPAGYDAAEIIDGTDKLATAGMVNSHTHAAMTLLRSYADDMNLMDWLQKKIWPAEAGLVAEDCYWGSELAILEMIKSGTTAFADMYFCMDQTAMAVEKSGIRASLARGLVGVTPDGDAKIEENAEFYKTWHKKANGRIQVMMGPHAPYTCPTEYLKKVVAKSEEIGAELHMHLSETEFEVKECIKEKGKTPIAYANDLGILDRGLLIAHAVWATDEELEIMAFKKARVAHNPQSNLKLASGIAPVAKMLAKGIPVGLGTDGASSNNNLDLLEECRLAAMLQKGTTYDPLVVPASEAWDMATYQGAKAIGFDNLGKLEEGYLADIVLYDMNKPHWYPRHDRLSLLVYAANSADADTVIIDGKVVMANGSVLNMDEEKIYAECETRGKRLIAN